MYTHMYIYIHTHICIYIYISRRVTLTRHRPAQVSQLCTSHVKIRWFEGHLDSSSSVWVSHILMGHATHVDKSEMYIYVHICTNTFICIYI